MVTLLHPGSAVSLLINWSRCCVGTFLAGWLDDEWTEDRLLEAVKPKPNYVNSPAPPDVFLSSHLISAPGQKILQAWSGRLSVSGDMSTSCLSWLGAKWDRETGSSHTLTARLSTNTWNSHVKKSVECLTGPKLTGVVYHLHTSWSGVLSRCISSLFWHMDQPVSWKSRQDLFNKLMQMKNSLSPSACLAATEFRIWLKEITQELSWGEPRRTRRI